MTEALDLGPIKKRDTDLRPDGDAWRCSRCDSCPECHRLITCEKHDDDEDVPKLIAEVERLLVEIKRLDKRAETTEKELRLAWRVADNAKAELVMSRKMAGEYRKDEA